MNEFREIIRSVDPVQATLDDLESLPGFFLAENNWQLMPEFSNTTRAGFFRLLNPIALQP